jgi:competence protein ComEA
VATETREAPTRDPRERLTSVLGSSPAEPFVDRHRSPLDEPSGRPPPSSDDPGSAWTAWIEESVAARPDAAPTLSPAGAGGPRAWLPAVVRGARFEPGRRGAAVLAVVAIAAALVAGLFVWGARPRAEPVSALPVVSVSEAQSARPAPPSGVAAPTTAATPAVVVVSVVGRVARPGLVSLAEGARVADVLAAAGGAQPGIDVSQLNLARRVGDGEQIAVGIPAAPDALPAAAAAPAAGGSPGGAAPAGPLDLNRAGIDQLDTLPGVGPVTAQRIVEWRTRNGRFARVEQLREIDGIGERRFEQLRTLVRV